MRLVLTIILVHALTLRTARAQETTDDAVRLETELHELLENERWEYDEATDLFVNIILTLETPTALALLEKHYYRNRGIMNKSSGIREAFREALVFTARAETSRLFVDRFLSGEYLRIAVPAGEEWTKNLHRQRLNEMVLLAPSVLAPDRATDLLISLYGTMEEQEGRMRTSVQQAIAAGLVEIGTDKAFTFLNAKLDEVMFGGTLRWRLIYSADDRAADMLLHRLERVEVIVDAEDYTWPEDEPEKRRNRVKSVASVNLHALIGEATGMFDDNTWLFERRDQKTGVELWSMGTLRRIRSQLHAMTPRLLEYGIGHDEVTRVIERLDEIIKERRDQRGNG